jgi:hypothetical protein
MTRAKFLCNPKSISLITLTIWSRSLRIDASTFCGMGLGSVHFPAFVNIRNESHFPRYHSFALIAFDTSSGLFRFGESLLFRIVNWHQFVSMLLLSSSVNGDFANMSRLPRSNLIQNQNSANSCPEDIDSDEIRAKQKRLIVHF